MLEWSWSVAMENILFDYPTDLNYQYVRTLIKHLVHINYFAESNQTSKAVESHKALQNNIAMELHHGMKFAVSN